MHLRADSATVSWDVPEGDVIIGFSISQQRQDGQMQRFIREVNTTSRTCVLWDLEEETDYIIQVQSIGLYGESQASKRVHFRTLKKSDRFPSNSSNQDDPTVQGLDKSRNLQTGEMIIIVVVLLMWAAVIALFCRQYDIIKDNDSSNSKEKVKPCSERSTPEHHSGGLLRSKVGTGRGRIAIALVLAVQTSSLDPTDKPARFTHPSPPSTSSKSEASSICLEVSCPFLLPLHPPAMGPPYCPEHESSPGLGSRQPLGAHSDTIPKLASFLG
ncbi:fibronectin type III domain-containing protein 5b isoform X2 [Paramormyrops kingsleyae]